MPFESILLKDQKKIAENWKEVLSFLDKLENSDTQWIFRGQDCNEVPSPVLERNIKSLKNSLEDAFYVEFALFDRFKRNIHWIDPSLPRELPKVETLALMRHHGAPTRLIDFTYSFYVALFFAIENLQGKSPLIWAINSSKLQDTVRTYLEVEESSFQPGKSDDEFTKYFLREGDTGFKPFVYQITPEYLNPRISIQQGTFLCPSDIRLTFEANFAAPLGNEIQPDDIIRLLRISPNLRVDALKELYQMNITNASLFQGIDGFARSLDQMINFSSLKNFYIKKRKDFIERERNGFKNCPL